MKASPAGGNVTMVLLRKRSKVVVATALISFGLVAGVAGGLAVYSLSVGEAPFAAIRATTPSATPSLLPGGVRLTPENMSRVVNAPNPFPQVVAMVNTEPIEGQILAWRVENSRMYYESTGQVPPESQLVQEALDKLIREKLFEQEARARGLWPSRDEVVAYAQKKKKGLLEVPADSPERRAVELQAVEVMYAALGFSINEMDSNPRSLEILEGEMAGIRLANQIEQGLPVEQRQDLRAAQAALLAFKDSLRSKADVVVLIAQ